MRSPIQASKVLTVQCQHVVTRSDLLAVEEPLTILVTHGPIHARQRSIHTVTMRTPGQDADLAFGLLYSDRVIRHSREVLSIATTGEANTIRVELHPAVTYDADLHHRVSYRSSSCGLCGSTNIEAVLQQCDNQLSLSGQVHPALVHDLPVKLQQAQATFAQTGGLHAVAVFNASGELMRICEDVGRHNAMDKLLGAELQANRLPLSDRVVMVSARASFELVQKAIQAGVPILAAVGAPSSLAVQLAQEAGLTLLGFVRDQRFNVYAGAERLALPTPSSES